MSTPRTTPRTALATAALVLLLTACADDGSADAAPDEASASTTTTPTEPSETPTDPAPTSTIVPEPTVAPATGPELEQDAASLRLPEGWQLDELQASYLASGNDARLGQGNIGLSQFPSLVSNPTDAMIERSTNRTRFQGKGEVLDPVDVGGVEMLHVAGRAGTVLEDEYVALVDGDLVSITFSTEPGLDEAQRDELVASVLASVTWR